MIEIFGILASWTVTLGSGKDDYQLQKGIKMLCRELSSFNWNGFVILRCLGSFFDTLIVNFGSIRVWTISDWTEFGLVRPSLSSFLMSAVMSFALVSFFFA